MKDKELKVSANYPTPYEYALISQAIYQDNWTNINDLTRAQHDLFNKGWKLEENLISQDGYVAGILVNPDKNQIVIAHRGSKSLESWLADVELVMRNQKGSFLELAINTLHHETVQKYLKEGFRLSTTGHSLGGYLAQVCAFWAQRADHAATYCPEISAVCFDAPGAVRMMEALKSNIISEQGKIEIDKLDIHNFCMSTIVSLFGGHTGTLYHIPGAENVSFSFLMAHPMEHVLEAFDKKTELPHVFRKMTDWPHFELNDYLELKKELEDVVTHPLKSIPKVVNEIYKRFFKKDPYSSTLFDQFFTKNGPIVKYFETQKKYGKWPTIENVEAEISMAIQNHYQSLSEQSSRLSISLCHFDPQVQELLLSLDTAKKYGLDSLGWFETLKEYYGEEFLTLTEGLQLKKQGDKIDLVLPVDMNNIFLFRELLLSIILIKNKLISLPDFIAEKSHQYTNDVDVLKTLTTANQEIINNLSDENKEMKQDLIILKQQLEQDMKKAKKFKFESDSTHIKAPDAKVLKVKGPDTYTNTLNLLTEAAQQAKNYPGSFCVKFDETIIDSPNALLVHTTENGQKNAQKFLEKMANLQKTEPKNSEQHGRKLDLHTNTFRPTNKNCNENIIDMSNEERKNDSFDLC